MVRARAGLCLVIGWLGAATGLMAEPQPFAARSGLQAAVAGLTEPVDSATLLRQTDRILADLGLDRGPAGQPALSVLPDFAMTGGALVELVDLRLLLTQIAVQTGARDHQTLIRAQGDHARKVILLRGGSVSLSDFVDLAQGTPAEGFVTRTAEGVTLTRPLAIWSDAGLQVAGDDVLMLDGAAGSFVANLGWLDIPGGTLSGGELLNAAEPGFRPFVLTAGLGRLTARGASLQGLGFGDTPVFGGVSVVNTGLNLPPFPSRIIDSTLIDVSTLSILGTEGVVISSNHIAGARGTALTVSRSRNAVVSDNRLDGLSGPQGIRVTSASAGVAILDNILTGGARTGVLVDQDSADITIARNLVVGAQTTGVSIGESACVTIRDNLIARSGGTGVSIRRSDGIAVQENAILFNKGAAVMIRDQDAQAVALLSANVVLGNREGLRGATPGLVVTVGNDLNGQLPRVFAGDLAPMMIDWLRRGQADESAATARAFPATAQCADQGQG